jgi:hypothetical protein
MKDHQRRYRRWLRFYPKAYRLEHGDEILATLLDGVSEHREPSVIDLLHLMAHAVRARLRFSGGRLQRPAMPQSVRLVTWLLVGFAAIDLYGSVYTHGGPKNPGPNLSGIGTGVAFLGLNLLIQARRRLLYLLAIGVMVAFVVGGLLTSGPSPAGFLVEVPYLFFILLLLAGWHRYMAAISGSEQKAERTLQSP